MTETESDARAILLLAVNQVLAEVDDNTTYGQAAGGHEFRPADVAADLEITVDRVLKSVQWLGARNAVHLMQTMGGLVAFWVTEDGRHLVEQWNDEQRQEHAADFRNALETAERTAWWQSPPWYQRFWTFLNQPLTVAIIAAVLGVAGIYIAHSQGWVK